LQPKMSNIWKNKKLIFFIPFWVLAFDNHCLNGEWFSKFFMFG